MSDGIKLKKVNLTYLMILMLYYMLTLLLAALREHAGINLASDFFYIVTPAAQVFFILIPVCICVKSSGVRLKEALLLNRPALLPSVLILLISFPALVVSGFLNSAVIYLLQGTGSLSMSTLPVPASIGEFAAGVTAIALFPAVCEELLHRGIIMSTYKRFGTTAAVVVSAILFGIFHFDVTNFAGPVFTGLLLGYYVIRTNSVFSAILAHFVNNFIIVTLGCFNGFSADGITSISYDELGYGFFLCMAALLLISMLLRFFTSVTVRTAKVNVNVADSVRKLS